LSFAQETQKREGTPVYQLLSNGSYRKVRTLHASNTTNRGRGRALQSGTPTQNQSIENARVSETAPNAVNVLFLASVSNSIVNYDSYYFGNTKSIITSGSLASGIAVSAGAPLSSSFSIDLEGSYFSRRLNFPNSKSKLSVDSKWLELSSRFSYWPVSQVSLGAGPYIAYPVGDQSIDFNDTGEIAQSSRGPAGLKRLDWGLASAIGTRLPVNESMAFVAMFRYQLGISQNERESTNLINQKLNYRFRDYQTALGFSFGL